MYSSEIPDDIRRRVEYRRGGSIATMTRMDLSRTALLVVDVQNYFWMKDLPVLYTPEMEDIVDNTNTLVDISRDLGVPIYWVQHSFTQGWKSWYQKTTKGEVAEVMIQHTAPGSFGFDVHESMHVRPHDIRVPKTRYSTMLPNSSDIDAQLRARGIETLIITGGLTNCCCECTARDAMMMDYDVVFVSDANATRSEAQHLATLVSMVQLFADVRDTNALIDMMKRSSEPKFAAAEASS